VRIFVVVEDQAGPGPDPANWVPVVAYTTRREAEQDVFERQSSAQVYEIELIKDE
jgi:hypothetical protein